MMGHRMMSGCPVAGGNRVADLFVMIVMHPGELFHADSPIGAVPFPLPDRTASGARVMAQEGNQERVARDLRDRLVEGVIRAIAARATACLTPFGNALAQKGDVIFHAPRRGGRRHLWLEQTPCVSQPL